VRKMLENAAESHTSGARCVGQPFHTFLSLCHRLRMNITIAPIAPTTSAAAQSIMMIILMTLTVGLSIRFLIALEVVGFWVTESRIMLNMTKRTKPTTDAKRMNMNFLTVRQGWTKARTKAAAARKASSKPGGLSSIPITTETIVNKPQTTKRITVLFLLPGVEKASIMTISFLIIDFIGGCPTVCVTCAGAGTAKPSNWKNNKA
jgi:hypothetical protein